MYNLTTKEEHMFSLSPWSHPDSPIFVKELSDDAYMKVPLFRQVERLLQLCSTKNGIKLTPRGMLPLRVVREVYELGVKDSLSEWYDRLSEEKCAPVILTRLILTGTGLARKYNGYLVATKQGRSMLEGPVRDFLNIVLQYLTRDFDMGYFDGYRNIPAFNSSYCFLIMSFGKWGDTLRGVDFYKDKIIECDEMWAAAALENSYASYDRLTSCLSVRFFKRYLGFLGLAQIENESFTDPGKVVKTPLFDELIGFTHPLETFGE